MPARLLPTAALLASLLAGAAAAQSPVQFASAPLDAPVAADSFAPSLDVYAGRYAADGGEVEVTAGRRGVVVTAHGPAVAAALAGLAAPNAALDARAATLFDAWVGGDLAALVEAVPLSARDAARRDFAAARHAMTRHHGAARSAALDGTFRRTDGRTVSLAHVAFERGAEWLSLVWRADGSLATVTRGLGGAVVGTARPDGRDAFAAGTARLTFTRDADGRVSGLRVGDTFAAQR